VTGQGVLNFRKWYLKHAEEFWKDLYTYLSHFDALRGNKELVEDVYKSWLFQK